MVKRWMGVALMAAGLAVAVPARAQYMPVPVGAARMPEPLPAGPSCNPPPPNLVPGPLSPEAAPMGPPNDLSLPCDHSSAFQCEEFVGENHCYISAGAQWLQRQKLGAGVIAVAEPDHAVVQELNNITQTMNTGVRATVGYMWGDCAVEYTGFFIPQTDKTISSFKPGLLDVLFANPPPDLLGVGSPFLRGDRVTTTFGSSFWNNEVNVRHWNIGIQGADLICGVRYVEEDETLTTNTEPNRNLFFPFRSITNEVHTINRIVAPQLGAEWSCPVLPCLSLGFTCKGAWGANFLLTHTDMMRADGLESFDNRHRQVVFAQIYDLGLFADVFVLDRLRVRAGYNTMWLTGVATAPDQIDFNLHGTSGGDKLNTNGSIFWHGPMVELQFLF